MTGTGWMGPDAEAPAMPVSGQLLRNRERGPGDTLKIALARSRAAEAREARDEAAAVRDPDEVAAALINRGLAPGMMSDLGQRLADVEAELAGEHAKIAKGERVTARVRGMLERGQIGGLDVARMLDGDFGDAQRAVQLERRAERLRVQLADAQALIAPQQERELTGVEAASRHAHDLFVKATRARLAEAETGRPAPRPFASRAGADVPAEPVTCPTCLEMGASGEESFMIHHTDADGNPLTAEPELAASEGEAGRGERWPVPSGGPGREITRAVGLNAAGEYGNHNPVAYR